ncbi:hypothetical protein PCANB_001451 [Pneumocystis canis]|nr:hypothetical protein PCK1_001615 [Pneumocystis canis]KAG5439152.1 hypothetical protein PCANB_001451 [Pneumocystis canis]
MLNIFSENIIQRIIFSKEHKSYEKSSLSFNDLYKNPFEMFQFWYEQAMQLPEPNIVTFSTSELPSGRVSSRIVLLKELDTRGFIIYTNLETSRKSRDLRSNTWAALTFYWGPLEKQVRIEGKVERLSIEKSQEYFNTRPLLSRISAWASKQSHYLTSRSELEEKVEIIKEKFSEALKDENSKIPVPPFWGGLRIVPESIEFWQGRKDRLHDRFIYIKQENEWEIHRLSP